MGELTQHLYTARGGGSIDPHGVTGTGTELPSQYGRPAIIQQGKGGSPIAHNSHNGGVKGSRIGDSLTDNDAIAAAVRVGHIIGQGDGKRIPGEGHSGGDHEVGAELAAIVIEVIASHFSHLLSRGESRSPPRMLVTQQPQLQPP